MLRCGARRVLNLQGDVAKMQGELIQLLAKSHCATGSKKEVSLRKRQGEASEIAGTRGLLRGLIQGCSLGNQIRTFFLRLADGAVGKSIQRIF